MATFVLFIDSHIMQLKVEGVLKPTTLNYVNASIKNQRLGISSETFSRSASQFWPFSRHLQQKPSAYVLR